MTSMYDVLKASKGLPVDDIFAELWGRKLSGDYTIVTYTGTLPATLTGTKAGYLHRYKIYGNLEQTGTPTPENPIYPSECGERTENLCDKNTASTGGYISISGVTPSANGVRSAYIPVKPSTAYYISNSITISTFYAGVYYDINKEPLSNISLLAASATITTPSNAAYIRINTIVTRLDNCMLTEGSTAPTSYIPYGFKLPLTSAGQNVDIYLGDDTLSTDEYVDYGTQKIYKDVDIWDPNGTTINNQGETRPGNTLVGNIKYSLKNNSAYTFYYRIGASSTSSTAISAGTELSITPSDTLYIWSPVSAGMSNFMAFTKQFVDPPMSFPQIPTSANSTTISWAGSGLAPSEVEFEYERK